jgi:DNA-binding HxlR family transcriptional regulator
MLAGSRDPHDRSRPRQYDRFCALALALDQVGDRWTLLIVLALLRGPRTYSELKRYVAGAGSNVLPDRLRSLSANGIVGRAAGDSPGSDITYHLTERGYELGPAVGGLAKWGSRSLWPSTDDKPRVFDRTWTIDASGDTIDESYQWTISGTTFELAVRGSQLLRMPGRAVAPVARFETTRETYESIILGFQSVADAVARRDARVKGSKEAIRRMFAVVGLGAGRVDI